MKILIYGINGWIGAKIAEEFKSKGYDVISPIIRADGSFDDVLNEIAQASPDRVFCVIGRTHGEGINTIDYLEGEGKLVENIRDNLYGPLNISLACKELNIHLTYMGTGCIFNDEDMVSSPDRRTFKETDEPNFFGSSYSIVKGFSDRLIGGCSSLSSNTLNLRIRMPITSVDEPRNFISKIIRYEKVCSIPNSMTVMDEIVPIMVDMSTQKHVGTINLTNPGTISHNEILDLYTEMVDPDFSYQNFTIEEQNKILKSSRSNNHLDTTRLTSLYPGVDDIKTAVIKVLSKWKKQI